MAPQGYRLQPVATIIEPDKVGKEKIIIMAVASEFITLNSLGKSSTQNQLLYPYRK